MSISYSSRIVALRYNVCGDSDIEASSVVRVVEADIIRGGKTVKGGPNDERMGVIGKKQHCESCGLSKAGCLGHEGHYELSYPVMNPLAMSEALKWLKIVCLNCSELVVPKTDLDWLAPRSRFVMAVKIGKSKTLKCPKCDRVHENIVKDKKMPLRYLAKERSEKGKSGDSRIYMPHSVKEVLDRITDDLVVYLGRPLASHPRNFVLTRMRIIPPNARPESFRNTKKKKDELTTLIQLIISSSNKLGPDYAQKLANSVDDDPLVKKAYDLCMNYHAMISGKKTQSGGSMSISSKIISKEGQIRSNILGRRCGRTSRSTIRGEVYLILSSVGVPYFVAKTQCMELIVQDYNRAEAIGYILNGRDKYPGCSAVKKRNGRLIDISHFNVEDLENGDTVLRDIITGDYLNANRQPSLTYTNMCAHTAVVSVDKNMNSFQFDTAHCPYYGADFDGDQVNYYTYERIETRSEISLNSRPSNFFISYTTCAPQTGLIDDGIIGASKLTRHGVKFDKYHMALMFSNIGMTPNLNRDTNTFTGYDLVTYLLENTPVNYNKVPMCYDKSLEHIVNYDPMDTKVVIDNGVHKSGVLDKKSIGKAAMGGLFHVITIDHGSDAAIEVMYNMKLAAINHTRMHGGTAGLLDLVLPESTRRQIAAISQGIINNANVVTDRFIRNEIIPPLNKTVRQFYEEQIINELKVTDNFREPVILALDPVNNGIYSLSVNGSKGTLGNMSHMMTSIGQKLINSERIAQNFGHQRTLVFFKRYDAGALACGYVPSSFMEGLSVTDYIFGAMDARWGLISKLLSTSRTGDQFRKSMKNLESIIINNLYQAVKGNFITQTMYGGDALDPRRLEKVEFPTIMISDDALYKKYHYHGAGGKLRSTDLDAAINIAYQGIVADREKFRKYYLKFENTAKTTLLTNERYSPVNVERMVEKYRKLGDGPVEPVDASGLLARVAKVLTLCDILPYAYTNNRQRELGAKLCESLRCACWYVNILIKTYLTPSVLETMSMPQVDAVVRAIYVKLQMSIMSPGTAVGILAAMSFSEPLTQYMLDSHTRVATGGTENTGMKRTVEILGALDTDRMATPSMFLRLPSEIEHDKLKAQAVADSLEMVKLAQFIEPPARIFYEKYGEPVHKDYVDDKEMFTIFAKYNPTLKQPGNLLRWCIRFEISRNVLLLKNIDLELIIKTIRTAYPDVFVVYTPESYKKIIIRIYIKSTQFKTCNEHVVTAFTNSLMDMIIRGVEGIYSATVEPLLRHTVKPDGELVRMTDAYAIVTSGTNLAAMLFRRDIDPKRAISNSIREMNRIYGIDAARTKIIHEMMQIIGHMNPRHYEIYANEMTVTGDVTSIERTGMSVRDIGNNLLKLSFAAPLRVLETAVVNADTDVVGGISGPLMVGRVPDIGTIYNKFRVNVDFVRKNTVSPESYLDAL